MPDPVPNPELMRSLGRLVRGLSALFWGLPSSLIICFHTARAEGFKMFGVIPPMAATALLVFGLWQLADFQKQERVWRGALDRARVLSLVIFGLSPFLYWWYRLPENVFFGAMVAVLAVSGLLFLGSLNLMLQRLGAMLPDETLRLEIRHFTRMNLNLLLATGLLAVLSLALGQFARLPLYLQALMVVLDRGRFWLLVLLLLLPLAMTMALIWKTKEVILENIFSAKS